jgi:hypothetical protein
VLQSSILDKMMSSPRKSILINPPRLKRLKSTRILADFSSIQIF